MINVLYLRLLSPPRPVLSTVRLPPTDEGEAGARVGVDDNNTTGRFLDHEYRLEVISSTDAQVIRSAAAAWAGRGNSLVVANLPTELLLSLMDESQLGGGLVFNAGNADDLLRTRECRARLLHTVPSRAMLSDALAQFAVKRRWKKWLLVQGSFPEDERLAAAMQRAARRFGADVVEARHWTFDTDQRRAAAREVPLFTQHRAYDVTVVADEIGDFGEYLPYNTWLPRPVAGTQGLTPTAWHWSLEQWGATQLQNRFRDAVSRDMKPLDYAAWLAVRAIGEAVTRTGRADARTLSDYLLSERFQLSAFKGRRLSFRPFNGQLRQPIMLVQPMAKVGEAPEEGFLHPRTELDTLGYDAPEVTCRFVPG